MGNYILYMTPSRTFWGFLAYFLMLIGFFLDIKQQSAIIGQTVQINQDIAESIRAENAQFESIRSMAESNAQNTEEVANQA